MPERELKCIHCNNVLRQNSRFCNSCGKEFLSESQKENSLPLKITIGFYLIFLLFQVILSFGKFGGNYLTELTVDSVFCLLCIVFAFHNRKELKKIVEFKKLKLKIVIIVLLSLPALAFLVTIFANYLNKSFLNSSEETYIEIFKTSPAPFLFTILSIAVVPAIFEELIFRGVLFNHLKKVMGIKPTIIVTTFLFSMLHLSVISLLWIFPIGLFFGYLRAKYRTLWYGVLGHFIYNACIVIFQMV